MSRLARRISPDLAGYPVLPLLLLFALNLVDEFDIQAMNILGPEIRDEFGLSNAGLGGLRLMAALAGLAIPFIGFAGDRYARVRIVWIGAAVWGLFAFGSGVAPAVGAMALARFGSGTGKLVNTSVHSSLLADYYPPQARGRIFAFHRSADFFAGFIGPALAGLIAYLIDWRAAFMILAVPTFVLAAIATRLPEPLRGQTDDAEAAREAAEEDAVPFGRSMRWLYSVPTLKRIYWGAFCTGLGGIAYAVYAPVFLEEVFSVNELQRGIITASGAPFGLVAVWLGGRVTDRYLRTKTMGHITAFFGFAVLGLGVSLLVYAVSPTLWFAVGTVWVIGFFLGLWLPPYLTILGFVSPARIRSLGFSFAGWFFTLGIVGIIFIGAIADGPGPRWALAVAAVILAAGGLVHASASRFANRDVDRAVKVLQTEANLRAERQNAGTRSLLVIRDLDVAYGQTQVLFDVELEIKEGELVALLGTNGAGKSTLLKAISGLNHPSKGAIFFDGRDITHLEPEETAEAGIIQMPGGKAVFPTLTVAENLEMAGWLYTKDKTYLREARRRALEIFPQLAGRMDQQAGSLSGGEQQMLSLAQAFIARPRLLMIDELSLGLAPLVVQQLLGIVKEIHAAGTTIILVEQSVNVALTVAEHAYFMEKGEIRFDGPTDELLGRTDILRSVFLEGAGSVVGTR